ncbi:hypothetical protein CHLRE_09g395100v5 [Chlamydomonas reinhardtii]|uniref:Uncharacterized protein n=1 Tax=Chlamydomonas reinhardtii TaxID=3055 RepID=A8IZX5_CHLRE|nr:uncharacterized protein CHLRE_09g395100v5 [Chlamydomonas reinhardtii]PNW78495.1 hypothetical protein CHLRE_09g395100v5 [Chlamydomonas reinhardtii]|eukprot:XP_001694599.1 map kinase phosphatase 4 [Chlamydomonas reinhardtii]
MAKSPTQFVDIQTAPAQVNGCQAVTPGLLISSFAVEASESQLREQGVTHILQVGIELKSSHPGKFEYLVVPILDAEGVDLVATLPPMFGFIEAAAAKGGVVLVHCMMGISRSASTVIAYLMWKEHIGFVAAAERVYAARPFISPNPGFVLQLRLWEKMGMDFAGWQGWSRTKFLETVEEWGGMNACMFDSVMREGGVSLEAVSHTPRHLGLTSGSQGQLIVPTPAVKRRPMPVKFQHRFCCIS